MASISGYPREATAYSTATSELDEILAQMEELRSAVVAAWQARAVVLQKDEQQILRAEIAKTCDLLSALVARS